METWTTGTSLRDLRAVGSAAVHDSRRRVPNRVPRVGGASGLANALAADWLDRSPVLRDGFSRHVTGRGGG
jgi:hypothetical protein